MMDRKTVRVIKKRMKFSREINMFKELPNKMYLTSFLSIFAFNYRITRSVCYSYVIDDGLYMGFIISQFESYFITKRILTDIPFLYSAIASLFFFIPAKELPV